MYVFLFFFFKIFNALEIIYPICSKVKSKYRSHFLRSVSHVFLGQFFFNIIFENILKFLKYIENFFFFDEIFLLSKISCLQIHDYFYQRRF